MPRIPTYDSAQVAPGALPGVTQTPISPSLFGMGAAQVIEQGKALTTTGAQVAEIALDIQRNYNEARVKELDTLASEADRRDLHDPEQGYLSATGKSAVERRADAIKQVEDRYRAAPDGLDNDMQRRMWRDVAQRRQQAALLAIDSHAARETKTYNLRQSEARISTAVQDAVANVGNEKLRLEFKNTALLELDALAALVGMSPDERKAAGTKVTTEIHEAAINLMVARQQGDKARLYYTQNEEEIDPRRRDTLLAKMDNAGNAAKATSTADALTKQFGTDLPKQQAELLRLYEAGDISAEVRATVEQRLEHKSNTAINTSVVNVADELTARFGLDFGKQQKELQSRFAAGNISAEVRTRAEQRLEHLARAAKAGADAGYAASLGRVQDFALKNPGASLEDIAQRFPGEFNAIKRRGQLDSLASFLSSGVYKLDMNKWLEFTSMPNEQLATMTNAEYTAQYRTAFDNTHFQQGASILQAARGMTKDGRPVDPKHLSIFTVNERIQRAARDLAIIPWGGKPSDNQVQAYGAFERNVAERVRTFETDELKGRRPANDTEVQRVIDGLMSDKVFVKNWIMPDTPRPVIVLDDSGRKSAYVIVDGQKVPVAKIPPENRIAIITSLRRRGLPVTEQAIAEVWTEFKAGR